MVGNTLTALMVLLTCLMNVGCSTPPDCDGKVDLVFMFDSSESVRDGDPDGQPLYQWERVKRFARAVTQNLPVGVAPHQTQVASLKFSTDANVEFDFTRHTTSIRVQDAIAKMGLQGGNTNAAKGLKKTREELFSRSTRGARRVLVLISDGMWNVQAESAVPEVNAMRTTSTPPEIFTVAMSQEIHEENLKRISSQPHNKYFINLGGISSFEESSLKVAHRICNVPDPTAAPIEPSNCMTDCMECSRKTDCRKCLPGKFFDGTRCANCMQYCEVCSSTTSCERCFVGWYWDVVLNRCEECEVRADMALLIDDSGSIQDKDKRNYQILKDFISSLINRLDVGPDTTRVGAIKFSTRSETLFHLDSYNTKSSLKRAIQAMHYTGGHTNTSGALRLMRRDLFRQDRGDRPDIRNLVLLITDGESTMDSNLTIPEANMAKQDDAVIFVVGITNMINEEELKNIASKPVSDHYFNSTDIGMLYSLETQIIKHVCRPENPNTVRNKRSVEDTAKAAVAESPAGLESGSAWGSVVSCVKAVRQTLLSTLFSSS